MTGDAQAVGQLLTAFLLFVFSVMLYTDDPAAEKQGRVLGILRTSDGRTSLSISRIGAVICGLGGAYMVVRAIMTLAS
jgi:hypothetical protein